MTFALPFSVWQCPDVTNGNATFLSPTDAITLTGTAGPGTGSRIDLIVTKQNNVENGDADSRANVTLVTGVPGAPGVAPTVPTGATLYATITVPASVANSAACTVVIARPSTYAPLPIKATTYALLLTVTGVTGQHATVTADAVLSNIGDYVWVTAWVRVASFTVPNCHLTTSAAGATSGTPNAFTAVPYNVTAFDAATMHSNVTNNTRITVPIPGVYRAVHKVQTTSVGFDSAVGIMVNGTLLAESIVYATHNTTNGAFPLTSTLVKLNAGDYVEAGVAGTAAGLSLGSVNCHFELEFVSN